MAVPNRSGVPEKTSQTEQYVLNYSFDEIYKILMVGLAGFNTTGSTYDRIQVDNASGGLKTSPASGILVPEKYDYISLAQASTTDTWSYKNGGAAGTLVATVTVTYTDSTKATIQSVAKT